MPWPLPKPAWLPRWLSTGDPHAHQAGPCRWVMPGVCREGSRCLFSQDLANSKPSSICRYWQAGYCACALAGTSTGASAAAGGAVGSPSAAADVLAAPTVTLVLTSLHLL